MATEARRLGVLLRTSPRMTLMGSLTGCLIEDVWGLVAIDNKPFQLEHMRAEGCSILSPNM